MKVYLCEDIHKAAYDKLAQHAEIISEESRLPEVEAIINRNLQIDRAWMDRCPNLRIIGIHGTGTDGVDLMAAREKGIHVFNVPHQNARSVAELIVSFALILSRKLALADRLILAGNVKENAPAYLRGMELSGKTFGMIGCGEIACMAAAILRDGFGMKILGYSPHLTEEKARKGGFAYAATMEEVLENADIINIGASLNESTKNMIDYDKLKLVKKHAMLINTARGGIVVEEDLARALQDGTLAAAACDVFTQEPVNSKNPLIGLPNFVATPHIGATTEEALYRVGINVVDGILAFDQTGDSGKNPCC